MNLFLSLFHITHYDPLHTINLLQCMTPLLLLQAFVSSFLVLTHSFVNDVLFAVALSHVLTFLPDHIVMLYLVKLILDFVAAFLIVAVVSALAYSPVMDPLMVASVFVPLCAMTV